MAWLSITKAAEHVSMSTRSIRRYIKDGLIRVHTFPSPTGGLALRRINTSELDTLAMPITTEPATPGTPTRSQLKRLIRYPTNLHR